MGVYVFFFFTPLRNSEALFNFYFPLFFLFHPQNSVAVASIHLPLAGTPISSSALQSVDNSTCKLQFIVFRNGKLFPCTGNSSNLADDGKRRSVSTPVAFTKLGKRKSIFIIMMSTPYYCAGTRTTCMHTHADSLISFALRNMLPHHTHTHTHTNTLSQPRAHDGKKNKNPKSLHLFVFIPLALMK